MSLKPSALKAMGIEQDKIEQIMEMHNETLASIKADKDKALDELKVLREEAGKVDDLEKELTKLKDTSEKYSNLKKEFEAYRGEITAKETKATKTKAYRELLKEVGISEKRLDSVMRVADFDTIELDEDGNLKDADKLKTQIKDEWSDFIVRTGTQGAKTPTPPSNTGGKSSLTKEQILDIKDPVARHKAMAENMEMFGIGKE